MFRFYTLKLQFSILKLHIEHARDFWQCLEVAWTLYFKGEKVLSLLSYAESGKKPLKFGNIEKNEKFLSGDSNLQPSDQQVKP